MRYLSSTNNQHTLASTILIVLATLNVLAVANQWEGGPLRLATGLLLACLAPGYGLHFALYPNDIAWTERLALSLGLSFVVVVLLGIVLNALPIGLFGSGFVLGLWGITIVSIAIGHFRRYRSAEQPAIEPEPRPVSAPAQYGGLVVLLGGSLVAALLGVWAFHNVVAATNVAPKPFTSLALEPVQRADASQLIVIENHENQTHTYELEIQVAGRTIASWPDITLAPGVRWQVIPPTIPAKQTAEVRLFIKGEQQPFRTIELGAQR